MAHIIDGEITVLPNVYVTYTYLLIPGTYVFYLLEIVEQVCIVLGFVRIHVKGQLYFTGWVKSCERFTLPVL